MRKRVHADPLVLFTCGYQYNAPVASAPNYTWVRTATWNNASFRSLYPNLEWSECFDELHKGPPYVEGGPFNKWTFSTNGGIPQSVDDRMSRPYGATIYKYAGGFVSSTNPTLADFASPVASLAALKKPGSYPGVFGVDGSNVWGDFSGAGALAWNKYRPGKPGADAAVFFGEIHEVPRMLRDAARKWNDSYVSLFGRNPYGKLKDRADSWLAMQFGWLPFLNDLAKFYKAWQKADKIMSWLIRNNGRWVRRAGPIEELTTETNELVANQTIPSMTSSYVKLNPVLSDLWLTPPGPYGTRIVRRITTSECWFEGRFRYYIPDVGSVKWRKAFVRQLFGLQLSPSLVWELTPWSWLIDWFSNVGEVLSNYSETGFVNNLAAKYAYVMGTKRVVLTDEHFISTNPSIKTNFWYKLERKSRTEANPFGFGVSWDALTPRQWAILQALGLKRANF